MTEHRLGDLLESVVSGSDSEKVAYNKIGGGILAEVPLKCRGVVASQRRCLTGRGGSDGGEDGPLEYQICQFEVRFGDGAFGVGEADQILGYAGCPLDAPGVVLAVFFWVYTYPPGTNAQSVGVAEVRSGMMDQILKVGGAVYHLSTQVALELDVLVELGIEVGRQPFCRSGGGEGDLHCAEVPDGPRHGKVHGVELYDEALHILGGYMPLAIRYLQKGDELEVSLGR